MNHRILVVDDNSVNLKLAGDLLEFEGLEVQRAVDAESAIEMINVSPPDLILMDVALPGMDGLTLTKLLKKDPLTMRIIIVALTAFAMKGDQEKITAAGCDGYITKPIDTRKFPQQVIGFFNGKTIAT
ncbi:MAG: response regulator [Bacteroidetes bacterium]|nr:response regulator [Bacteroidota bacterium]